MYKLLSMKLDMNLEEKKFGVQSWLKSSVAIIEKYKWLIDIYVLDFFVDNHWSILRCEISDFCLLSFCQIEKT